MQQSFSLPVKMRTVLFFVTECVFIDPLKLLYQQG